VMYLGKVVEFGPAEEIFQKPRHPYTQALFDSIPHLRSRGTESLKTLEGQIPSPINPPSGCPFHTRCPACSAECKKQKPELREVSPGHFTACYHL